MPVVASVPTLLETLWETTMKKYLAACALCGLFAVPVLAANAAVDSAVKTFDAVANDPAKLKTYCEMSNVMSWADTVDDSNANTVATQMVASKLHDVPTFHKAFELMLVLDFDSA